MEPDNRGGSYALLSHGVRNGLLAQNVASGIGVKGKLRAGENMQPYEDAEVAALLALAAKEQHAARRWIPLLAACSGARAGELAQLWAERVREIDGVLAMELRPAEDGGSFKNAGSERTVPLHPALAEAGFLDFVEQQGRGPLFYGRATGRGERHASKGTVNHLAGWIRKQPGFDNPRKAPNHALRHRWKSTAAKVGIPDSRADAIQGHKPQGEGTRYRHLKLKTLAEDVARIPIPRS
jgi:integrase